VSVKGLLQLLRKLLSAYVSDSDVLCARVLQNLDQNTLLLELEVHLSLVGLDLDQNITGSQSITGLLLPGSNVTSSHGGRQSGHGDDGVRGEGYIEDRSAIDWAEVTGGTYTWRHSIC